MINLDEFALRPIPRAAGHKSKAEAAKQREPRNSRQHAAYAALTKPMRTRDMAEKLGWTTHTVSAALSALKGKGKVVNNGHGIWRRT